MERHDWDGHPEQSEVSEEQPRNEHAGNDPDQSRNECFHRVQPNKVAQPERRSRPGSSANAVAAAGLANRTLSSHVTSARGPLDNPKQLRFSVHVQNSRYRGRKFQPLMFRQIPKPITHSTRPQQLGLEVAQVRDEAFV